VGKVAQEGAMCKVALCVKLLTVARDEEVSHAARFEKRLVLDALRAQSACRRLRRRRRERRRTRAVWRPSGARGVSD